MALAVQPAEESAKQEELVNAFYRLVLGPFEDYNAAKQELDRLMARHAYSNSLRVNIVGISR